MAKCRSLDHEGFLSGFYVSTLAISPRVTTDRATKTREIQRFCSSIRYMLRMFQDPVHVVDVPGSGICCGCSRIRHMLWMFQDPAYVVDVPGSSTCCWCSRIRHMMLMFQDPVHVVDVPGSGIWCWCSRIQYMLWMFQDPVQVASSSIFVISYLVSYLVICIYEIHQ